MPKSVALVTGASAGLGEQFARLFAEHGIDVVLVARDRERLAMLARGLAAHGVSAHALAVDLSRPNAPQEIASWATTKGFEVDYLVNNAGFGFAGAFLDLPLEAELREIQVNCVALVALTHLFGEAMRHRKKGRILNIASTAGFQPGPYMATYYATKAFVLSFTEAVATELEGSGVFVTCHCPGPTETEFSRRAGIDDSLLFKRRYAVASASDTAMHAFTAMMEGQVLAVPGFLNNAGTFLGRFVPRGFLRSVTAKLNRSATPLDPPANV